MTLPLISILIPVFNNEERIERAVRSAYSQAYFNESYEVVVLDDGSDDSTLEVLMELRDEYPDMKILHNDEHTGNLNARWRLFNESSGAFVFYLCGDCSMPRKALWKSYDAIVKYDVDMLVTAYIPTIVGMRQPRIGIADNAEWYGTTFGRDFISKAAAASRGCFNGHGKLVRREMLSRMFEAYGDYYRSDEPIDTRDGEIFVALLAKANPLMKIAAQDIETTMVVLPRRDEDLKPVTKNRLYAEKFNAEMRGRAVLKQILSRGEYATFDVAAEFDVRPAGDIKCDKLIDALQDIKQLLTPRGFAKIADQWLGWAIDSMVKRCSADLWKFLNVTSDEANRTGQMLIFDQGRIAYNPRWAIERLGTQNLVLRQKENNDYSQFKNVAQLSDHDAMLDCYAYQGPFLMIGSQNLEGLRMSLFFWMVDRKYYWYV